MPGRGRGFGGPTSGRDLLSRIKDRFLGGVEGQVYTTGGDGIRPDRNGVRGNMLDGTDIGGIIGIRARGRNVRVGPGDDARDVVRATNAITGQVAETAQGIDDIKTGRYDVGRAEYRDEPRDTSRRGKRNSGPEQYEQDYLRQSGEIAPDDAAPQVTKPPATPKELEAAQQQGGAFRPAPSATEVRTTDVPASGVADGVVHRDPTREEREQSQKFRQSLTTEELESLNSNGLVHRDPTKEEREQSQRFKQVIEARSTKDVPASGQPSMEERAAAFKVDSIDQAKNAQDKVVISNGSGSALVDKNDPTKVTFSPPSKDSSGFDIKEFVGKPVDTALLNQLSAKGISFEQRIGQGGEAINILTTRKGEIIGGYKGDAEGKQTIISRDDLSTRLADVGKDLNQFEKQFQVVHAELNEKLQSALKPAALDQSARMADQTITAKPPTMA